MKKLSNFPRNCNDLTIFSDLGKFLSSFYKVYQFMPTHVKKKLLPSDFNDTPNWKMVLKFWRILKWNISFRLIFEPFEAIPTPNQKIYKKY